MNASGLRLAMQSLLSSALAPRQYFGYTGALDDIGGSKRNEAIRHGILVQRRHSRRQKETKSGDAVDRHLRHVHDPRNSFRAAATRHNETSTSRLGEYVSPRRWEVVKSGDAGSRRLGTTSASTSRSGEYVALPRRWKKRRLRAPPNTSRITTRSLPHAAQAAKRKDRHHSDTQDDIHISPSTPAPSKRRAALSATPTRSYTPPSTSILSSSTTLFRFTDSAQKDAVAPREILTPSETETEASHCPTPSSGLRRRRLQADRLGASGQRRRRRRGDSSSAALAGGNAAPDEDAYLPRTPSPQYTSASAQFVAALFLVLALVVVLVLRARVSKLRLRVLSIAGDETGPNGRSFVGTGRASSTGARTITPSPSPLSPGAAQHENPRLLLRQGSPTPRPTPLSLSVHNVVADPHIRLRVIAQTDAAPSRRVLSGKRIQICPAPDERPEYIHTHHRPAPFISKSSSDVSSSSSREPPCLFGTTSTGSDVDSWRRSSCTPSWKLRWALGEPSPTNVLSESLLLLAPRFSVFILVLVLRFDSTSSLGRVYGTGGDRGKLRASWALGDLRAPLLGSSAGPWRTFAQLKSWRVDIELACVSESFPSTGTPILPSKLRFVQSPLRSSRVLPPFRTASWSWSWSWESDARVFREDVNVYALPGGVRGAASIAGGGVGAQGEGDVSWARSALGDLRASLGVLVGPGVAVGAAYFRFSKDRRRCPSVVSRRVAQHHIPDSVFVCKASPTPSSSSSRARLASGLRMRTSTGGEEALLGSGRSSSLCVLVGSVSRWAHTAQHNTMEIPVSVSAFVKDRRPPCMLAKSASAGDLFSPLMYFPVFTSPI
ncbi:hypothetical protein B0H13DRAFT_2337985 [Mycena leptocephala]|nr:hypothetical protein B0H13DRAFT_2337985 [Mycena leptocephala]